jgi:uncharacterized protein YggE
VAVLAAALASGAALADTHAGAAPQITVTGEGRVQVTPDMATITIGAQNEAETAADALAATSAATAQIIARLTEAGIEARDIQTANLSLSPRYENYRGDGSQPRLLGYVASNTVQVRVRDLETLGARLDASVAAGGNQFGGLAFGLQVPGPVEDEARRRAVADALRKAELYATAAGLALGSVQSIAEQGGYGGPQPMFRSEAMVADAAVPVAPGELEIGATVVITFGLAAQ